MVIQNESALFEDKLYPGGFETRTNSDRVWIDGAGLGQLQRKQRTKILSAIGITVNESIQDIFPGRQLKIEMLSHYAEGKSFIVGYGFEFEIWNADCIDI